MSHERLAGVILVVAKASIFYGVVILAVSELVSLNMVVAASVPWSIVTAPLILWAAIAAIGTRWSRIPISPSDRPTGYWAKYISCALITCLSVLLVQGAVFSVTSTALPLEGSDERLLALGYAVAVPVLSAILEEVTFRGILQGGLQLALGRRAAAWTAGTVFVLAHVAQGHVVPMLGLYCAIAVTTGVAAFRTQSLLPGMLLHSGVNIVSGWTPLILGPIPLGRMPVWAGIVIAAVGMIAGICAVKQWPGLLPCDPHQGQS